MATNPATITTVANTVATLTVAGGQGEIEVFNVSGTDTIWVSEGSTTPTVGGQGFWPVPPGMRVGLHPPYVDGVQVSVKVISPGVNTVTGFGCSD